MLPPIPPLQMRPPETRLQSRNISQRESHGGSYGTWSLIGVSIVLIVSIVADVADVSSVMDVKIVSIVLSAFGDTIV